MYMKSIVLIYIHIKKPSLYPLKGSENKVLSRTLYNLDIHSYCGKQAKIFLCRVCRTASMPSKQSSRVVTR